MDSVVDIIKHFIFAAAAAFVCMVFTKGAVLLFGEDDMTGGAVFATFALLCGLVTLLQAGRLVATLLSFTDEL